MLESRRDLEVFGFSSAIMKTLWRRREIGKIVERCEKFDNIATASRTIKQRSQEKLSEFKVNPEKGD